jgi:hypothetical protein
MCYVFFYSPLESLPLLRKVFFCNNISNTLRAATVAFLFSAHIRNMTVLETYKSKAAVLVVMVIVVDEDMVLERDNKELNSKMNEEKI